jgi:hypothetical protein
MEILKERNTYELGVTAFRAIIGPELDAYGTSIRSIKLLWEDLAALENATVASIRMKFAKVEARRIAIAEATNEYRMREQAQVDVLKGSYFFIMRFCANEES